MVYMNGTEVVNRVAEISLYPLFFGELVLHFNQSGNLKLQQELETFRDTIYDTMKKPVLKMLGAPSPVNIR